MRNLATRDQYRKCHLCAAPVKGHKFVLIERRGFQGWVRTYRLCGPCGDPLMSVMAEMQGRVRP